MANYRLYSLDGEGHVVTADWFEAQSDEDAILLAREKLGKAPFEIWQAGRLVARIGQTSRDGVGGR